MYLTLIKFLACNFFALREQIRKLCGSNNVGCMDFFHNNVIRTEYLKAIILEAKYIYILATQNISDILCTAILFCIETLALLSITDKYI